MAKLTVPVNSAGGNTGPIKGKVYERRRVYDNLLGLKSVKLYKLIRSGINEYEGFPQYDRTILNGSLNGRHFNLYYGTYSGVEGHENEYTPVISYYAWSDNYEEATINALYIIADDKWVINSSPYKSLDRKSVV